MRVDTLSRRRKEDVLVIWAHRLVQRKSPRLLVNLWPQDRAASQEMLRKFYRLWAAGDATAASALAQAMGHVANTPKWHRPRYWAGWQLWSDVE